MSACGAISGYIADGSGCCDSDADAFPDNGLSATVPNDCGDYDYDCDGEETLGESGTASCPDTVTVGYEGECNPIGAGWIAVGTEDDWLTPPPACGHSGLLLDSCGYDVICEPMLNENIYVCRPLGSDAVQPCH
ncbi:MAG: hypothetical protein ACPGU1_15795 [Myxococcota bacterium]